MPTDKQSADINQLKRYDVLEEFTKVANESSSKNEALVSFIADLLKKIQEDNVYVSADVEKKISELITDDYKKLLVLMLEDDTFISRISEIIQNNIIELEKANGKDFTKPQINPDELSKLIESTMEKNMGKTTESTDKEVEEARKKLEENRKKREEAYKRIVENSTSRRKTSSAPPPPSSKPKTTSMATAAKERTDFFSPLMTSFIFMKDFDTNIVEMTTFKFKKLNNLIKNAGKSIVRGVTSTIRKLTKAAPKAILTGLFGPFGLIFLPVFKVVGLGFKLVGVVFNIGKWAFRTVGKLIGLVFSPFRALFGKVHDKFMNDKGILAGIRKFILSPVGLFVLGYGIGFIIGWIRKTYLKKKEMRKNVKELTEEQKKKIQERFDHYALTGFGWDIARIILGPKGAEKLDNGLKTIGTLLFGWDSVDKRIKSNVEKATNKAMGKRDTKSFSFMETASKVKEFFTEKLWPKIMDIKNAILKSKIWNYFKGKDVLPMILAFAWTVNDVAKYMINAAPAIFVAIFGKYAVKGATKGALWALRKFGGAATKKALGGSLMASPWTWVGVAVLAAGAGLMNGINDIIKSQLDAAERLGQSDENQAEAIRQLSGEKGGSFYDTETKEATGKSIFSVGHGGIAGIMSSNLVEAQKVIGDGQAKIDSVADSYQNIDTSEIDRMQELGGMPPQQSPGVEFDLGEYANEVGKEMEAASKARGEPTVNMPEFQKPEGAEDSSTRSAFDRLGKLLDIDATDPTGKSVLPNKFSIEDIMAEEKRHSISVPRHIHPYLFKTFRAMLLKNLLAMYKSGQIDEGKFIDMYNRSINPEDKMYKVYAMNKPAGFEFSGISKEDARRLDSIFNLGDVGKTLDAAKQVPYYVLFQMYKFKGNNENKFFDAFTKYRKNTDKLSTQGMDKANAEMLSLGADQMEGNAAYNWMSTSSSTSVRLNRIRGMYAEKRQNALESIASFKDLTRDMDKNGADYDAYVELQKMYEKFRSSANTMDIVETDEEIKKRTEAFRDAFLKKKQELMSANGNVQLEKTLDEQGTISNMEIAKDAGKESSEMTAKAFDDVRTEAVKESKKDMEEYSEGQKTVEELDKESIELAEENEKLDKELEELREGEEGKAPNKDSKNKNAHGGQGSRSTQENLAAMERESLAVSVRKNHYAMDSKVGDRVNHRTRHH